MKLNGEWKLGFCMHGQWKECSSECRTYADLEKLNIQVIDAKVPGNFEIDFENAGLIEPIFFGRNLNQERKREMLHLFYSRKFLFQPEENAEYILCFEGIDTVADIYVNGVFLAHTDNMLISHEISLDAKILRNGENEVLVHILPVTIEARKYDYNLLENSARYNRDGLHIRKSAYMFGWDIFPRMLSGGIWKDVYLKKKEKFSFLQSYLYVRELKKDYSAAELEYFCELDLGDEEYEGLQIEISGHCRNSEFKKVEDVWGKSIHMKLSIENPVLWWPKRMGKPHLYAVEARLLKEGKVIAEKQFSTGIRTIELHKTSTTDKNGEGEFCFFVNGQRLFVLGTNWVPLDSLPSRGKEKIADALALVEDVNCNMIRCWGGGYYEDELFYEICDQKGILVWQDFMQACAIYPHTEEFLEKFRKEVVFQIRRLRQHPCIALWSGDNENDVFYDLMTDHRVNPNDNPNTRSVIPKALRENDYLREYLPSSPYIDSTAWKAMETGAGDVPEQHLWGPRDYYKGSFYKDATAHFASETGYHGCPCVESIRKFISPEALWPYQGNGEWLLHASSPTEKEEEDYAYRIQLMASQIKVLFGEVPDNLEEFSLLSQISQAEAKKYFIERFRIGKWRRTGIIWWNMLDGCPQFSDAVVDYYFSRKLAYHYIKRSQEMAALMFDEPENGKISLFGVSDYWDDKTVSYRVTDLVSEKVMAEGECLIKANTSEVLTTVSTNSDNCFYLIEWTIDGKTYKNHYMTWNCPIDKERYLEMADKAGILQNH